MLPARVDVPVTLMRSAVFGWKLTSVAYFPPADCTKLPVNVVLKTFERPPGENVPLLVSVLPVPTLAIRPLLKIAPDWLTKLLVPAPRSTEPVIVPKFD